MATVATTVRLTRIRCARRNSSLTRCCPDPLAKMAVTSRSGSLMSAFSASGARACSQRTAARPRSLSARLRSRLPDGRRFSSVARSSPADQVPSSSLACTRSSSFPSASGGIIQPPSFCENLQSTSAPAIV